MYYKSTHEEYKYDFFELPMAFFTNDKYLNMSNNAKVAWAILKDKTKLSKINNWYEKDTGRVYVIFTNEQLMDELNVKSRSTIVSIKKELETLDLIEQKRVSFNNRIYILYPEVTDEDIRMINQIETYEPEENNHVR